MIIKSKIPNFNTEVIMSTKYTRLTKESPLAEQPASIKVLMKPHQLAMLNYTSMLEQTCNDKPILIDKDESSTKIKVNFGVIADNVGSGKSLMILSMIAREKLLKYIPDDYRSTSGIMSIETKYKKVDDYLPINLVVVPHGIYNQWCKYINDYTNLSYFGINNKKKVKEFNNLIKKIRYGEGDSNSTSDNLADYDLVLTTNTRYNEIASSLFIQVGRRYRISRLIIDEADSIKIQAAREIDSSFTWFVSSSYENIIHPSGRKVYTNSQGQTSDYYDYYSGFTITKYINKGIEYTGFIRDRCRYLSYLNEYYLKMIIIKNSSNFVKESFSLPEPIIHNILCENTNVVNVLGSVLSRDVLSHINAGDIQGAIEKLSCTKVSEQNVIKAATDDLNIELNNKKVEYEMKTKMIYSSENAKKNALEKIQMKIFDLEGKIQQIKNRLGENDMCPICYDEVDNATIAQCCNNKFCFGCLSHWLSSNKNCPLCRTTITINDLIVITEDECESKEKKVLKGKEYHLIEILKNLNEKSKVLIFSEYNNSFGIVERELNRLNIKSGIIKGNSIENTIRSYKSNEPDSIKALMLNSRFFGSGLNLENSTDIIMYHAMSPEITKQVIGRAQRPGRTGPLNIWNLRYSQE